MRVPADPVALALLRAAAVPVAAPSANRFGHVSPTSAAHVLADLGHCPIGVVDPSDTAELLAEPRGACAVGIESTVVGIAEGGRSLKVFRRGGAPLAALTKALITAGIEDVEVVVVGRAAQSQDAAPTMGAADDVVTAASRDEAGAEPAARPTAAEAAAAEAAEAAEAGAGAGLEAPGQLLTHYAPDVPASLVAWVRPATAAGGAGDWRVRPLTGARVSAVPLVECVVLDIAGELSASGLGPETAGAGGAPLAYRCLDDVAADWSVGSAGSGPKTSAGGSAAGAGAVGDCQRNVFAALRWAEAVPGARAVLLCDPLRAGGAGAEGGDALRDRLFRAASGGFVGVEWTARS